VARDLLIRATEPGTEARMDFLYLGLTAVLFALSWGLIVACERLG
jgi:hypothetical protein